MTAEIEHWSAAGFRFFNKPMSHVAGLGVEPLKYVELSHHWPANLAGANDFLDASDSWIKMAVVSHTKSDVMRPAGVGHALALFNIQSHRLFAQDMFPGVRGGNGLGGMEVDRRGNVDGIDLFIEHQCLPFCAPLSSAELLRKRLDQFHAVARDRNQITVGQVTQRRSDTLARDVATANQSPSQFLHLSQSCLRG